MQRKTQYIVDVNGDVLGQQSKTYAITAKTDEEAQVLAKQIFNDEFVVVGECVSVKSSKRLRNAVISYVLLLVPIFLSLFLWTVEDSHKMIDISPNYLSCAISVLLYTAFVIRFKGIARTVGSWIDIGFCILIVLLFSSFIRTFLVGETTKLLGIVEIPIKPLYFFVVGLVLSWLGMKSISFIFMAIVWISALFNISDLSAAMSGYGAVYVISSFLGILFYLSVEPARNEMLSNFKVAAIRSIKHTKEDFLQAKQSLAKLKASATSPVSDLPESIAEPKKIESKNIK